VLLVVAIALPLFFTVCAFVVDGANLMVHRRSIQNAADASSLAAARGLANYQDAVPGDPTCTSNWATEKNSEPRKTIIPDVVVDYSSKNNVLSTLHGGSCSFDDRRCSDSGDSNCYTWPYKGNNGLLEVRLREPVGGFLTSVAHLKLFDVSARAVASVKAITEDHCVFNPPGSVSNPDQYLNTDPPCTIPAGQPTTGTYVPGVAGALAFIMSPTCDAISYSGAGGGTIGAFATNGGLTFSGNQNKKVDRLGYAKANCTNLNVAPNGDPSACTAAPSTSCVKNLTDLSSGVPFNWPVTPPTVPTAVQAPAVPTYPTQCRQLNSVFNITTRARNNNDVATLTTSVAHNLAVGDVVTVAGVQDNSFNGTVTVTAVGGGSTTFSYANTGPRVNSTSSAGTVTGANALISNGWPSAANPPGIYCLTGPSGTLTIANVDLSGGDGYTFFAPKIDVSGGALKFYWPSSQGPRPTSRPTSGYDSMTLLYASSSTGNQDIWIHGSGATLTGDIFAPLPNVFPPTTSTVGGNIFIAGGAVQAGSGFIEAWTMTIQGTTGSYTGTGPDIGAHCVFNPPVANPDQYLPSCVIPGSPARNGNRVTNVVGANLGMDE
jgi:hypothetical protein